MKKIVVLKAFADKDNFAKIYKEGDELIGFSEERITALVKRGLVGNELEKAVSPEIDLSQSWQQVVAQVKTFEDVDKLKKYLVQENAAKSPRASVVKAIEERITALVK